MRRGRQYHPIETPGSLLADTRARVQRDAQRQPIFVLELARFSSTRVVASFSKVRFPSSSSEILRLLMCDTILVPQTSSARRGMLFGKNSDRQRNEAQTVEYFPRVDYEGHEPLSCTYLTIPQAAGTHAVLLCRPFWTWGAEMGANEYGVVIGNEGLHARGRAPEEAALSGMDLLRLALERGTTAAEALEVITTLLQQYGQGGNCGHLTPSYYNNGFLLADPTEAYVLETVGRDWLSERVRGTHTLSNTYSIGQGADRVSEGLAARIPGYRPGVDAPPNFGEVIGDPNREHIGHARARRARSNLLLKAREGAVVIADIMSALRDHGPGVHSPTEYCPELVADITLCMHAKGQDRAGQTVGSMVSEIRKSQALHWVTGTAAPCISIFKPVLLDAPLPAHGPRPTDRFDSKSLWWRHERLHRSALMNNFAALLSDISPERNALEADFLARMETVLNGGETGERSRVVAECWKEATDAEDRWLWRIKNSIPPNERGDLTTWSEMNRIADVNLP